MTGAGLAPRGRCLGFHALMLGKGSAEENIQVEERSHRCIVDRMRAVVR
jgi:hypothetical protein